MNNLDIVLALFTTPNHRFSHVLIQRLHFKPQQVQLQTGFSRIELFPTIKPTKFIRLIIYDELSLLYHLFEGVCFGRRRRVAVLKS